MNTEQAKGQAKLFVSMFGGILIGWATKKGFDAGLVTQILNSEFFIGILAWIITAVLSWISKSKFGLILAASKVNELKEVGVSDPKLAKDLKEAGADVKVTVSR